MIIVLFYIKIYIVNSKNKIINLRLDGLKHQLLIGQVRAAVILFFFIVIYSKMWIVKIFCPGGQTCPIEITRLSIYWKRPRYR